MIDGIDTSRRPAQPGPSEPAVGLWTTVFVIGAAFAIGLIVALFMQVDWLAGIRASLSGTEPKAFWYLSRATAFVAFGLLWLSMALGLSITNKLARLWPGGPAATDLHQYSSLLGLAFGCLHGLLLTGDSYTNFTLTQVLLPFTSTQYRPVWVGLGQFGLYLGAVVAFSFYVRRFIGYRSWRLIHFGSFAVFALALLHGLFSGTDSTTLWAQGLYLSSGVSVLGLTLYRIRVARRTSARGAPRASVPLPTGTAPSHKA
jgi:predicted ferric reductase